MAEKKAAEAKVIIEKEKAEANIKAVETIENALEQKSVDELGFDIGGVLEHAENHPEDVDSKEVDVKVEVPPPFPVEEN